MIFMNNQMDKFYHDKKPIILPQPLKKLLRKGFFLVEQCVIFKQFSGLSHTIGMTESSIRDTHMNATGFECFANSFHLEDYVDDSIKSYTQAANIALQFVDEFKKQWKLQFSDPCVVILSIDKSSEFGPDAVFRFHKKRANEYWINVDALEKFNEAILVVEC